VIQVAPEDMPIENKSGTKSTPRAPAPKRAAPKGGGHGGRELASPAVKKRLASVSRFARP
jgi:hypothetical protein